MSLCLSARYESESAEPPSDCADCHLVAARRTNALLEETDDAIAGDSVRTFCTEGTPLVFLSTATSLTDLTGAGAKTDDEKGEEFVSKCNKKAPMLFSIFKFSKQIFS